MCSASVIFLYFLIDDYLDVDDCGGFGGFRGGSCGCISGAGGGGAGGKDFGGSHSIGGCRSAIDNFQINAIFWRVALFYHMAYAICCCGDSGCGDSGVVGSDCGCSKNCSALLMY